MLVKKSYETGSIFFTFWLISLFIPKYGILDFSLLVNFFIFLYSINKVKPIYSLVFFSVYWMFQSIFLYSLNSFNISLQTIFSKDFRLILMAFFLAFNFSFFLKFVNLDILNSIFFNFLKFFILFLIGIYYLQILSPDFKELSYSIVNFGNVYGNLDLLQLYSHGWRLPGIFQGYDIGSVWISIFIVILYFFYNYKNSFLYILIFIPFLLSSRTGTILIILFSLIYFILEGKSKFQFLSLFIIISSFGYYLFNYLSPINPFLWLVHDLKQEFKFFSHLNFPIFGNYQDFYFNGSVSDNGYEHIFLSYGLITLLFLFLFYSYYSFKFSIRFQKKFVFFILIYVFISCFKAPFFISRGFFEFFLYFIILFPKIYEKNLHPNASLQ